MSVHDELMQLRIQRTRKLGARRMKNDPKKLEHYVPAFIAALEEHQPRPADEPISLAELLAEYDPRVLKQWLEDQHTAEQAMNVPETRK